MSNTTRALLMGLVAGALTSVIISGLAFAQPAPKVDPATPTPAAAARMERLSGVWVEGPGFEVTYGGNYEGCSQKCIANTKCVMIEYYRPEKKCNLYDQLRPRKTGGSSDVAIRR